MKKKFTFLIAAVMLLMMMSLPGKVVGQTRCEAVAYTLTPASGSNNSYTGNCDITISGITWNLTGNSQQNPWRIGGKSLSGVDRSLYSKTAISDNISKIEVTHGAASSITVNSWTVIVASDASFDNVVSTLTPTFEANATTTITRPDGVNWRNCYFKFVYNVTVSGTNNKFLEFSEAKFYKGTSNVAMASVDNVDLSATYSGGSLSEGNNANIDQGAQVTLAANATTGYVLSSWVITKQSDDSNVTNSVLSGNTLTVPAYDINISATISQAQQYTITFNAGSGTCSTSSQNYYEGTVITEFPTAIPSDACSEAGYTFDGWSETSVNEGSSSYTKLTSYPVTGEATLYAVYKLTEGNVFDGTEGGSFIIYAMVGSTPYYAKGAVSSSALQMTTDIDDATEYTFEKGEGNNAGKFAIKTGNNYISHSGSSISNSNTAYYWSISQATHGSWRVAAPSTSRGLIYRASTYTTFKSYSTSNVNGTEYFDLEIGSSSTTYATSPVCYPKLATPVLSQGTDYYVGTQSVTITCEPSDAAIYYTLDGTNPSSSSTLYNGAISINESKTLKAIAIKSGYSNSDIVSATYTILTPLTTMQQIYNANTTSTAKKVAITFGNWVISGNNNGGGNNASRAWLTDNNGKGCSLHVNSGSVGFTANNVLIGTVICDLARIGSSAQIEGVTSSSTDINGDGIVAGDPSSVTVVENAAINSLTGLNTGSVVQINNLTCTSGNAISGYTMTDENSYIIYAKNLAYSSSSPFGLEVGKKYNLTGVYELSYTSKNIYPRSAADIEEVVPATITVSPTAMNFTYVDGESAANQTLTISGANLAENISGTLTGSDFSISDDGGTTWNKTAFTINKDDGGSILVRLNPELDISNDYSGSITLSSTGASNVVVELTGSVTTPTHALALYPTPAGHGTITFSPDSPVAEGSTVSLTATPDTGYDFGEWRIYKKVNEEYVLDNTVSVANNQFSMPTYDIWVDATFTAKPTYGIICATSPVAGGELISDPDEAYEGQTVTLSYSVNSGYTFSSIAITKTSDGTASGITPTASGNDYTFTMPGYAVTVTLTFLSENFDGDFLLYTGALVEGDYLIVYDNGAMNNTVTSSRFGYTNVAPSEDVISNPSNNIVWHIAPSETDGYWTIYNAKVGKYAGSMGTSSTMSLESSATDDKALWSPSGSYEFRHKLDASNTRYLRRNGTNGFANYSTVTGGSLTLYRYTPERTITFNGNGGTYNAATTYTQTVLDGIATNLNPNQFTNDNSAFAGWSTTENGEVEYANGALITVTADLILYAQWSAGHTITYFTNGIEESQTTSVADGNPIGILIEPTAANIPNGYTFVGWYNGDIALTQTAPTYVTASFVPTADMTLKAVFATAKLEPSTENASLTLKAGDVTWASGGSYGSGTATKDGIEFAIENGMSSTDYIQLSKTDGRVYNTTPFISITSITATVGANTILVYEGTTINPSSSTVSGSSNVYTFSDDMKYFAIKGNGAYTKVYFTINYVKPTTITVYSNYCTSVSRETDITGTIEDGHLTSDGTIPSNIAVYIKTPLTINSGKTLTVEGVLGNDVPANLIIEDGGQLICNNSVAATVKKTVEGYDAKTGENNGWMFIASPLSEDYTPAAPMTSNTYDLYQLNPSTSMWENYKPSGTGTPNANEGFKLVNGRGYLYANSGDVDLSFAGAIQPYDADYTISVSAGWNLIGNPYTFNAYPNTAYYTINDAKNGITAETTTTSDAVAPCTGIIIKAAASSTVTFSKTRDGSANNGNVQIALAQNVVTRGESSSQTLDNAIISFNEGSQLGKFYFGNQDANLYIPMDNEEYAIVSSSAQGEMPINFKAHRDGQYTITVNPQEVEMGYLHLIDNIGGKDIDLLATPSYTFNAKADDYESRFRLVFSANMVNTDLNDDFAFFSNGQLVIANEGESLLQVIDVNGRIVMTESVSGTCSKAINVKAGVYVLRLIQGTDVKTQKIIVK